MNNVAIHDLTLFLPFLVVPSTLLVRLLISESVQQGTVPIVTFTPPLNKQSFSFRKRTQMTGTT
jgi:hypothetical protein